MRQLATSRTAEIPQIASIPTPGSVSLAASLHDPKGLARQPPGPRQSDLNHAFPTGRMAHFAVGEDAPEQYARWMFLVLLRDASRPLRRPSVAMPLPLGSLS